MVYGADIGYRLHFLLGSPVKRLFPWIIVALLTGTLFLGIHRVLTATHAQEAATAALVSKIDLQSARIDRMSEIVTLSEAHSIGVNHTDIRIFAIKSQIAQTDDPVVIVGDSITEGALFPSVICGKLVINAGVGGADTGSYRAIARQIFSTKPVALIVVALGTNNSTRNASTANDFKASYDGLANDLATHAKAMMFAGIPAVDMTGALASQFFDSKTIDSNNEVVSKLATQRSIRFIDLRSEITGGTVDGVHLNAAGYKPWNLAITSAIAATLGCKMTAVK